MKTMRVPLVGDKTIEDGKLLQVTRVFTNKVGVKCVEYIDTNGLHGCVLPEYWFKKQEDYAKKNKKLDGQAGSEAPS